MAASKTPRKASAKKATRKRKAQAAAAPSEAGHPPAAGAGADGPVAPPEGDWVAQVQQARRGPVEVEEQATVTIQEDAPAGESSGHEEAPLEEPAAAARPAAAAVRASRRITAVNEGLSLPEQFLLVALRPGWDDRMERARPGGKGTAIVGSLLLDLALRGGLKVQRDRFQATGADVDDPDLQRVAGELAALADLPSREAMRRLAHKLTPRIRPWKQRLERRGMVRERTWRHLGLFPRSTTVLVDEEAQQKLVKRILRLLAGSGNPDAQSVLLLALMDASGLLEEMVPSSTLAFNRKRIQALLAGRDTLGYAVDSQLRQVQDVLVQTVLQNVKSAG
jgi:hypothetical protein